MKLSSIRLVQSRDAWGTPDFKPTLKRELGQMGVAELPRQQGLSSGSVALDDDVEAMILSVSETETVIHAKAGIFYQSIIAGCSCSDDPTPTDVCNEHCEVQLEIDKSTADTSIRLVIE